MSKIINKLTLLASLSMMAFLPLTSIEAAITTFDISSVANQPLIGDPYTGTQGVDFFDDFLTNFSGTFPISTGLLGQSINSESGFDTMFVIPQAPVNCTRYLNKATLQIAVVEPINIMFGFAIGLSEDAGVSISDTGTFSSNLFEGVFANGFGVGEITSTDGTITATQTFDTPVLVTEDSRYLLAVEDSISEFDVEYSIVNVTFNVTDDCNDNQLPVANPDTAQVSTGQSITIDVLANDNDLDNDSLVVTSVMISSGDTMGTLIINDDGTITYQPSDGFTGTTVIEYTIDDGNGGLTTSTLTINVLGVSDTNTKDVTIAQVSTLPKAGIPVALFSVIASAIILSVYKLRKNS
ncbi:cadherin-like domain-containing protein [Candidatus Saccharibacteria bacterium]|nr:cadherin-like domain-containing protein [Candidatus Saccharibacteria bacterium]